MSWVTSVELRPLQVRLLLTCPQSQSELLRARLPSPRHPRALLGLLEAMALWQGHPLRAAVFAECNCPGFEETLFDPLVADSALVELELLSPSCRRTRRLRGLGDFAELIRMQRRSV
jgi:hypothetical protein